MKLQGDFLDRCCQLALKIQAEKGKKLKDFEARKFTRHPNIDFLFSTGQGVRDSLAQFG